MKSTLASALAFFYRLLLSVYPSAYRAEFGNEMYSTFAEGVEEARAQGRLGRFLWNELRDMPRALAHAYWEGWMTKLQNRMEVLQDIASTSDLPPAPPDGRESWRQTFLELSLFIVAAVLLVMVTYFEGVNAGWQRDPGSLGKVMTLLTLPFLLLGLTLGLPRWAYPFGGLLLSYAGLIAGQTGLWLFLTIMLLASSLLFIAAILTDPQPSRLPIPIRRIGQSLSVDWTRLSFGIYGAMPLIILTAFDDAHINSRTPYFAFSVLVMIVGALIYCRSREATMQINVLLAGLTFSIWGAWLDKVSLVDGLVNWTTVTASGIESLAWMAMLWIQWAVLILSPVVLILFNRVVHLKPAA